VLHFSIEIALYYIRRDDHFGLYDDDGSFAEGRFFALIESRGWAATWPRTPTGLYARDTVTLGKQCKRRLVSNNEPANVFDDIEALRQLESVSIKWAPATEYFARISHDRARERGRRS
jgi:hypothetical protein